MNNSVHPERHYLFIIRRWLWLLVLVPVLAAAVSYFVFKAQPTIYEAEAQVLIGPSLDSPYPELNTLRASEHLMQTYRRLASTDSFLQEVIDDVRLEDMSPGELRGMLDLSADTNSLILSINVQSTDQEQSVAIANGIARQLVRISPSGPDNAAAGLKAQTIDQASQLQASIDQSEIRLVALEESVRKLDEATSQAASTSDSLSKAQSQLNDLESSYLSTNGLADQLAAGSKVLQELTKNTLLRIDALEADLATTDPNLQPITADQLAAERNHLSGLQKASVGLQPTIEGQPLDAFIAARQENIQSLEERLSQRLLDISLQRLLYDQLSDERDMLQQAENAAADLQKLVLVQISEERQRLTAAQSIPIEKRRYLSDQLAAERTRLDNMQKSFTALNEEIYQAWTNQAHLAQLAFRASPVASNMRLIVLMAAIAALALALAFVLALGYFDNALHFAGDLEMLTKLPLLGSIRRGIPAIHALFPFIKPARSVDETLAVLHQPSSQTAEDYRYVIAGLSSRLLDYGSEKESSNAKKEGSKNNDVVSLLIKDKDLRYSPPNPKPLRAILVSSLAREDMAGEVAANLALTLAHTGQQVLLVDANLHKPQIAKLFDIDADHGFTSGLADPQRPMKPVKFSPQLSILSGGPFLADAFGMAASERCPVLITQLRQQAAYVVIAGAPLMAYADTMLLAKYVDGVILAVEEDNIDRGLVEAFMKTNQLNNLPVLGFVTLRDQVQWKAAIFPNQEASPGSARPEKGGSETSLPRATNPGQ